MRPVLPVGPPARRIRFGSREPRVPASRTWFHEPEVLRSGVRLAGSGPVRELDPFFMNAGPIAARLVLDTVTSTIG